MAQVQTQFGYRRHPDQDRPGQNPAEHAIVVVGAGPVGLSLAIDLAQRGQRVLLLDDAGQPISPLISWMDRRAKELDKPLENLRDRSDFVAKTGLGIEFGPNFAISKCRWFVHNRPASWQQVSRFMTISDFLTYLGRR